MKLAKTLSIALIAGALINVQAGEGKSEGKQRKGPGPMLEHLLPPRVVEDLNLTADQKATFDGLESAFKKDAEKWRSEHRQNPEEFRKARESGDKEALQKIGEDRKQLMETRRSYMDKLRASLNDEQKSKLDESIGEFRKRHGKGQRSEKRED